MYAYIYHVGHSFESSLSDLGAFMLFSIPATN